jgi:hypothetical protein
LSNWKDPSVDEPEGNLRTNAVSPYLVEVPHYKYPVLAWYDEIAGLWYPVEYKYLRVPLKVISYSEIPGWDELKSAKQSLEGTGNIPAVRPISSSEPSSPFPPLYPKRET